MKALIEKYKTEDQISGNSLSLFIFVVITVVIIPCIGVLYK